MAKTLACSHQGRSAKSAKRFIGCPDLRERERAGLGQHSGTSPEREPGDAEFVCITGLADAQCFVGWEELVPAGLDVAELATADVVGQMLDVNLDPRAVGWEQVDGHAPLFPDQAGLSALGNQLGLDHSLLRLAWLRIGI